MIHCDNIYVQSETVMIHWYYICTVRDSVMIHCEAIYVQLETVWWSTVILYMYNQRQCDDPLWYYICTVRDSVMMHCDTIYVHLETVWWSTVILYMYRQRQCDEPLWYYICSQRKYDDPLWFYIICTVRVSVMIHCDTIYVQSEIVWWSTVILYMYS
jgi:hypothetical protein